MDKFKGDPKMAKAYKASAKMNMNVMKKERKEDYKHLSDLKESDIVIVRGCYDNGEVIFELCSIPFSLIDEGDVANVTLRDNQIIFINCPGKIPERGLEKIKSFVINGGMLVTTDWALTNVLEKIFPEYIKYNQRATSDDVVRVVFEKVDDTFLKGLLNSKDDPQWWLEGSSYPIQILNTSQVKVLVSSKEMQERYGESPIVVAFEVGKGKVYHMTSHLYLQRSETRSERHSSSALNYAVEKNMSMADFSKEEIDDLKDVNLSQVEAAYTSGQSIINMIVEQKRRVKERERKDEDRPSEC